MSRLLREWFKPSLFISVWVFSGCVSGEQHARDVQSKEGSNISLGKVQREIRVGMSSAEVIEALGSPNIVSTDPERREVWTYDKVSTETVYSSSEGGVAALVLGGYRYAGGGVGAGYSRAAGAQSTSQRTLTIIIKFDENGKVRDFAYRSSQF